MKIATPISSLFANKVQADEIIRWSDCLECRDHSPGADWPNEALFHTDIQPIHQITAEEWEHLRAIKKNKSALKLLSMHLASCYDKPVIVGGCFEPGGRKFSRAELLKNARENFTRIREIFGDGVELAVENNNYYSTPAYDLVCDADFINEIVCENRLRFLFDLAHGHITSVNKGMDFEDYKRQLPLDAVIQVHLCKHRVAEDGGAFDAHDLPGAEEFQEVLDLALRYRVEYLTIEFYKTAQELVSCLKEAHTLKNELIGTIV
jgi:uncharacterized protein (UPF0276 family)